MNKILQLEEWIESELIITNLSPEQVKQAILEHIKSYYE